MLIFLVLPVLCGFSSSGSFPKPFSYTEEKKYLTLLKDGNSEEKNFAKSLLRRVKSPLLSLASVQRMKFSIQKNLKLSERKPTSQPLTEARVLRAL